MAEEKGFEPLRRFHALRDFESRVKKRTWRNLTEDKGNSENPENPRCFQGSFSYYIKKHSENQGLKVFSDFAEF